MTQADRGRGRRTGLAVVVTLGILLTAGSLRAADPGVRPTTLVISDGQGSVLARVPLAEDGAFTLRYRNSLYGTVAEERFVAVAGRFELQELAARQLAVLEEYYAVSERPIRAPHGWWQAPPAYRMALDSLTVAATDLGRRTLLVAGQAPLELWRMVDDAAPSVVLETVPAG